MSRDAIAILAITAGSGLLIWAASLSGKSSPKQKTKTIEKMSVRELLDYRDQMVREENYAEAIKARDLLNSKFLTPQ